MKMEKVRWDHASYSNKKSYQLIDQARLEPIMATQLNRKEIVSFEVLLMSQVVQQEALIRLLVEKGIFTKEELLEMVRVVDRELRRSPK
jgi:hypothetical protein